MSWQAVKYVMDTSQAVDTDRLVFLAIAEAADAKTWDTFIGHDTIGKHAGGKDHPKSERTVQRSIKKLAAMGELEVILHGAPQLGRKFQHRSNLYRIIHDVPATSSGDKRDTSRSTSSGDKRDTSRSVLVVTDSVQIDAPCHDKAVTPYPSVKTYPSSSSGPKTAPKVEDDDFLTEARRAIAANRWEISNRAGKIADRGGQYGWINRTAANLHAEFEVTEMVRKLHAEFPDWSPRQVGDEIEPVDKPVSAPEDDRSWGYADDGDHRVWSRNGARWTAEDFATAKAGPDWKSEFHHDPYEDESYARIIQIAGAS